VSQGGLHHLRRAAHDSFGGVGRRARRLLIRVDQHHHVRGAIGHSPRHVQSPRRALTGQFTARNWSPGR